MAVTRSCCIFREEDLARVRPGRERWRAPAEEVEEVGGVPVAAAEEEEGG
jgi:hypothetical protein